MKISEGGQDGGGAFLFNGDRHSDWSVPGTVDKGDVGKDADILDAMTGWEDFINFGEEGLISVGVEVRVENVQG